jgi:hypothetical protein
LNFKYSQHRAGIERTDVGRGRQRALRAIQFLGRPGALILSARAQQRARGLDLGEMSSGFVQTKQARGWWRRVRLVFGAAK